MNLRHFIRITATPGVAALIAGCGESAPPGAASAPPSVPVAEVVVRPVTPYAEFTGSLTAVEQVELRPRVAGYIQDVTVPEGRLVEKGQQLFLIDPRVFKAAQDAARARLREAEAAALLARTEHERAELLYARKVVARERLDSAIASRNASKAQVDAARAALDAAQLDLGFTRVTAPIGGRVGHIQVTEGNYVTNGVTALTSIVSVDPLYVYFDVDERTYLQALAPTRGREGEQAPRVKVALLTDESYGRSSRLDFLANAADRGTGTVRVRAVVDNPDGQLTPGCSPRSGWRPASLASRCWSPTIPSAPTRAGAMCWSSTKATRPSTGRWNSGRWSTACGSSARACSRASASSSRA